MKIVICGSMAFSEYMLDTKQKLEERGHSVIVPQNTEKFSKGEFAKSAEEGKIKSKYDVIRYYHEKIKTSDAILVINKTKNDIPNYIGGNALIEMAFAYVLNKKIFLLHPILQMNYCAEIEATKPIVVNSNLDLIV